MTPPEAEGEAEALRGVAGPRRPLVVYGAGGHGRVVAEAAGLAGFEVLGFVDDRLDDGRGLPWPLLSWDDACASGARLIVGIGDNEARQAVLTKLARLGHAELARVIHPAAFVSPSAEVQAAVFVGPHAVIHTSAILSRGAIINSGVIVEHDCRIGECVHLAPGAAVGGEVVVGERTLIGLGARVLPRVRIGAGCVVGAGAVVIGDVGDGQTMVGGAGAGDSCNHDATRGRCGRHVMD